MGKQPPRVKNPLPDPLKRAAPRLTVDWPAYFAEFCRAHSADGGGPVVDGGRLLFADGWAYSADAYEGPEFPPPREPGAVEELQRRYWRRRRNIVRAERDALAHQLGGLNDLRKDRAVPLMVRRYLTDDGGREIPDPERPVGEPDWFALGERLRWLTRDVAHCERRLTELEQE